MGNDKSSALTIVRNIICTVLAFLVVMAVPTGWLYDLWAGTGTGQGQRPGEGVELLERQEDVENFFLSQTSATVADGELAACPLARLRDQEQAGKHTHMSHGARRSVFVSEYITTEYPVPGWERVVQGMICGGFYNRYYLMELRDNSWICVYFDDYLALTGTETYPTGYVRYTNTEERRMLKQMSEDYDIDPVYVLDMYRYGKVNWMLDLGLRLAVVFVIAFTVVTLQGLWKKRKITTQNEVNRT